MPGLHLAWSWKVPSPEAEPEGASSSSGTAQEEAWQPWVLLGGSVI